MRLIARLGEILLALFLKNQGIAHSFLTKVRPLPSVRTCPPMTAKCTHACGPSDRSVQAPHATRMPTYKSREKGPYGVSDIWRHWLLQKGKDVPWQLKKEDQEYQTSH